MPSDWFAPHAAGFGPLVARLAERDCPGAKVGADGDNALRVQYSARPERLLHYCRALFRVLARAPGGLERAARAIAADPRATAGLAASSGHRGTFVLRAFGPDDPASLPFELRRGIEASISRATGLRPDSGKPEREYRLQERADGMTLFLERAAGSAEEQPRRGELPRTTCRLLAEMSEPEPGDVFLDPFCGYGGIALERALAAPYRFVFASDIEEEKIAAVKASLTAKAFEKRRRTFFPKLRDALDGSAFEAGFATAIATDPPWGLYGGGLGKEGAETLLVAFVAEAERLLAPGGRLVLLIERSIRAEDALPRRGVFAQVEAFDVLVSGKKARALRFDKRL